MDAFSRKIIYLFFSFLLASLAMQRSAKASEPEVVSETFTAESKLIESGKPYTIDTYVVERANGKVKKIVVTYANPQSGDAASGQKVAELSSIFDLDSYLPQSEFHDFRSGFAYKVTPIAASNPTAKSQVKIEVRRKESSAWNEATIARRPDMMTLLGMSLYIEDHLKDFDVAGVSKIIDFIVPSRESDYGLRITAEAVSTDHLQVFHIKPQSFFLRLIAPAIDVTVNRERGRVAAVRGISNIRTVSGDTVTVETKFIYPDKEAKPK